jgi:hypothetical protein
MNLLYSRDNSLKRSLYDIRNDIAHGNISEQDFEQVSVIRQRLIDAQKVSKLVIIQSIIHAAPIVKNLS